MRRSSSAGVPSKSTSSTSTNARSTRWTAGGGSLATPEATRSILRRFGIRPSKRWGQHFLVSQRALDRILDSAALTPRDSVLEVGAGLGTLTVALAERAGCVTAIEVDRRLLPALAAAAAPHPNLRIVSGDVLDADLAALFGGPAASPRKAVANLPYNIAAPVLLRLLDPGLGMVRLVVTVQREVAERLSASPGTAAYGRLSVAVRYRAIPRIVARIPPGAFLPPPEVESAVVELVPLARPPVAVRDEAEFFRIVAAGFGHRRKTLANALTHGLGADGREILAACAAAGVNPRARAETLGLEEFAALARALHPVHTMRP